MRPSSLTRRLGFTLIEMLIVIVVIAILALIVIPRIMGAGRKSKEATLKANLREIRSTVERFYADTGCYPSNLEDMIIDVAHGGTAPTSGVDEAGNAVGITAGTYQGPYVAKGGGINGSGMPINPFSTVRGGDNHSDFLAHWSYSNGVVHPAVPATGTALDGIAYADM